MPSSKNRPWYRFWPENVPRHIEYPQVPLSQLLTDSAERYPEDIAFDCRGVGISYKELDTLTTRLALALRALGVVEKDRVLLLLPNSLQFIIAYYGVIKAGATVAPASPLSKSLELLQKVADLKAGMIITNGELGPAVDGVAGRAGAKTLIMPDDNRVIDISWLDRLVAAGSLAPVEIRPRRDVATILYTGGTTGVPKGAMLTHYNLVANAMQNAAWFGWGHRDVVIGLLPFYHTWGGCTCVNSPVYAGARVIILPRFDVEELLTTIQKERVTVLYGAASMFNVLLNSPLVDGHDLSSLRYVKAGAMPIPQELKARWEERTGVRMVLGYGLTEASPETHNNPPGRVRPETAGIPNIDTDARIVDAETGLVDLSPGEVGELVVRGPQVMKGYWRSPSDTRAALRRGWLYTGDLAFMDEEGYFCIVDRKKETIKYKGYTIAPAELEDVVYMHPGVTECAVVGIPAPVVGEIPKAFVVLKEGHQPDEEDIVRFCEERLAPYKKIRAVQFVDELPKTPVGKVLRRVLRDREVNQ